MFLSRFARLIAVCCSVFAFDCAAGETPSEPDPVVVDTNAAPAAGSVEVWLTNTNKSKLLQKQTNICLSADAGTNPLTVSVDPAIAYQSIDGFGYTLTGGSAYLINKMGTKQNALLNEIFGTGASSIGSSYLRLSMGASDLSAATFTYDDMPVGQTDTGLANFSIAAEMTDLIPVLKKILAINPSIKIIATPWSAPVWMKLNTTGYGGFQGGTLNPAYYGVYADYFVKYIQAMKANGITIDAVAPQNEPLNPHNNPSMYMSAAEQLDFIKNHLGPKLRAQGLQTKIVCYDHNADNIEYATAILSDPAASAYVDGSAFHLYGGNISALSTLHDAFPDKNLYFTEQWIGGPGNFGGDLGWHMSNVIIGATRNWSRNALEWNLASDPNYDPHTPGGCTNCMGAVTINGGTFSRNTAYYVIGHAAKFVRPGAVRIASNIAGSIENAAFKNTDGSLVLIAINRGNSTQTFKVKIGANAFSYTLTPGAVATFKWAANAALC